jgi:hypothetical protein
MTDAAKFRTDFPEFSDSTAYPDSQVTFWIGIATRLINADRWGDLTDFGIELLVAHNLVLWKQASKAAAGGGVPGLASGVTASKAVADVSVGYDTSVASVEDGGNYNLTTYGTRYLEFVSLFGAGGIQL